MLTLEAGLRFTRAKSRRPLSQFQPECQLLAFHIVCLGAHLYALSFRDTDATPFKGRACLIALVGRET